MSRALFVCVLCLSAPLGWAANQTDNFSTVEIGGLPYRVSLSPLDFGDANLPTLHSFAAGHHDGKWVLLAGRTNGLHGFEPNGAANFPPQYQNRDVWVIDPVSRQSWVRSLEDTASGLSVDEVRSLSPTNNQFFQRGDRLYMTGGYGVQLEFPDQSVLNGTFDKLSAVDLPGIIDWVMGGSGTAKEHIRQATSSHVRVTGGAMYEIDGRVHLVFGQNFQGNYTPSTNGIYTNQVRSFDIVDDGETLSIVNPTSTTPDPSYRRRDLNVVPVIRPADGGGVEQGLMALSGVFTPTFGAWTVPVEIDADGNPTMADPNDPNTFKQSMNGYHSAKVGLYSVASGEMHELLFGGISVQYLDDEGQIATDQNMPFVNDITSIVIDADGTYSQHRISEFPAIVDGNNQRLRFGANAEFIAAEGLDAYSNGVLDLDQLTQPTKIGYIFGGIVTNGPHTRGVPGVVSVGSNTIFEVTLIPVPEPQSATLLAGAVGLLFAAGWRAERRNLRFACS